MTVAGAGTLQRPGTLSVPASAEVPGYLMEHPTCGVWTG